MISLRWHPKDQLPLPLCVRFLLTVPSSNADEQLLAQILHMISLILTAPSRPSQDLLDWISEMLYHPKSAILGLVARPDAPGEEAIETTLHIRRWGY